MASNKGYLAGKTVFITGASRGIGRAIALKAARDGAKIVVAAKTSDPHPKLPGTIYTVAKEVEEAGGQCLPCVVDIRSEEQVQSAVDAAVKKFGGIDILVNNASAISLTNTLNTPMKRYDLMNEINTRGTYLCSRACLPHLQNGNNPHILNISPPLNLNPKWFKNHVAYTIAKYGMSLCVLGMSEELKDEGIAVNALWPRTAIMTAAMEMLGGGKEIANQCRKADIMSDAAYIILSTKDCATTGQFLIDDEVLSKAGVTDLDEYSCVPGSKLMPDFFLDEANPDIIKENGASTDVPGTDSQVVKATFAGIEKILSPDIVSKVGMIYVFKLSDNDVGEWTIDLKNGAGSVEKGPDANADCTFEMDSRTFIDVFEGKVQTTQAFMNGKMKIKGNMMAAMKLETLMKKVRPKL